MYIFSVFRVKISYYYINSINSKRLLIATNPMIFETDGTVLYKS